MNLELTTSIKNAARVGLMILGLTGRLFGADPEAMRGIAGTVLLNDYLATESVDEAIQPAVGWGVYVARDGAPPLINFESGGEMHPHDGYGLVVEAVTDVYLYVFQIDAKDKRFVLFPSFPGERFAVGRNPVVAGTTVVLPAEGKLFQLDDEPGQEIIYLVAASAPLPRLLELVTHASADPNDRPAGGAEPMKPETFRGVSSIVPIRGSRPAVRFELDSRAWKRSLEGVDGVIFERMVIDKIVPQ